MESTFRNVESRVLGAVPPLDRVGEQMMWYW